jgi:hypothetical protein
MVCSLGGHCLLHGGERCGVAIERQYACAGLQESRHQRLAQATGGAGDDDGAF